MRWPSMLAIYFLFWAFSVFFVLAFDGEDRIAGTVASAPREFSAGRVALRVTIVATVLFAVFLLNYSFGWVTVQDLDLFDPVNRAG